MAEVINSERSDLGNVHVRDSDVVDWEGGASGEDMAPTLYKKVRRSGIHPHNQTLRGVMFDINGINGQQIKADVHSEMIYSFSPSTEWMFSNKLVDPNREQTILANSPGMIWYKGKFYVVMRMWLDKEITLNRVRNTFSDNYFFMRTYNDKMESMDDKGRVMGILTRVHESVGE